MPWKLSVDGCPSGYGWSCSLTTQVTSHVIRCFCLQKSSVFSRNFAYMTILGGWKSVAKVENNRWKLTDEISVAKFYAWTWTTETDFLLFDRSKYPTRAKKALAKLLIWPAVTIAQDYGTWLAPLRNRPRESCSSEQQGHQISGRKHRRHLRQERQYTLHSQDKEHYQTNIHHIRIVW